MASEALKALIFDLDGTLAETEEFHRKAFNTTFHFNKIDWFWDKALYGRLLVVAGGKERIKYFNETFLLKSLPLKNSDIETLHRQKTLNYSKLISDSVINLRPGIKELLKKAKANNKQLALATSTSRNNVNSLIEACFDEKPEEIFNFIATGELVKEKKPSPDLYELVLTKLNLKPQQCLAFEDSRIGLISARQAKIETIVSPSYYNLRESFEDADYLIKNFLFEEFPTDLKRRISS